ncbi:cytochrome c oxidase assembly protein [Streptomyces sp. NRRL B-1347]|uniref:cytochrome c oxidase assembly protein n=1 Tax=Streptomyces sp. NRRL B-1347 TaxID=1476877 RepID=UPI00069062DC|nr:cytochrome c oxidase assembly protein [Streptomyces sp. NRRL B-1347]
MTTVLAVTVPWHVLRPAFTGHTVAHLGAGMAAPLLGVLARPVTLALRVASAAVRRRLVRVVQSRTAAVLVFPPVAALVDVGGLGVLYRAPLPADVHHSTWVLVHLFAAGTLFTYAVLGLDPVRHRAGFSLRAGTLLAGAAGHAVLARGLWAAGPPGSAYAAGDLRLASQLMYYGGDVVEVLLAAVLAHQWYRAEGRALARERRDLARHGV